ncbi:thiamine-phosphate kinase [Candidimonas sp. SYP-B2681]|uniref:thiamine-phosphate kinase n=1 Tax=Candidimonas sp. SYP-B2681 TaxID=2497686 RepID=UPI000F884335|nr:thiamine-phosphate kinase [Candidimonas sp. SYP-B2681]RTZ39999.1 thiamine-phosphate kinase [Candidimonas sp. SYP-B2681]
MNIEFDLIARYFSRPAPPGFLGVGDDCALFPVKPGYHLATSTDLLIEGRHFFADVDPAALGHKSLAVNLSDLAAMGAQPVACLLSLSLPAVDHHWLAAFAEGFYALADQSACPLIGGDTTRSVTGTVISVTVMGQVRPQEALRRSAAMVGDDIWITGTLGAADIALRLLQGKLPANPSLLANTRSALEKPLPPWTFGEYLAGVAHAGLDISDGLVQDLGHILKASRCGAEINYEALPIAPALLGLDARLIQDAVLTGGDVYQLCFTASAADRQRIMALAGRASVQLARVGQIVAEPGLRVRASDGALITVGNGGFDHFS